MSQIGIRLKACDGDTIFNLDVPDVDTVELLQEIVDLSKKYSPYRCHPVFEIGPAHPTEEVEQQID